MNLFSTTFLSLSLSLSPLSLYIHLSILLFCLGEQAGTGFEWPWAFYVSFKSYSSEWSWHTSEARVTYEMHRRSIPTREGESPFHFFDGATMLSFRFPNKSREVVFCRRTPTPETCKPSGHGFDLDKPNVPLSSLEVKKSGTGANSGYGLFTKVDIPVISYIGIETSVHAVIFEADTHELLDSFDGNNYNPSTEIVMKAGIGEVLAYVWGYGFSHQPFVSPIEHFQCRDFVGSTHPICLLTCCLALSSPRSRLSAGKNSDDS